MKADAHRRKLIELTQEKEDLEIELAQKSADFRRGQEANALAPDQLRTALPTEAALVDFLEYRHYEPDPNAKGKFRFERRLLAFVVHRDRPVVRIDLGAADRIDTAVDAWRKAAVARASFQAKNHGGHALRRLLWEPLEKHIAGAKIVLVAPDGATASVPFAALPGKEDGKFLLEEITLAVVPLPRKVPGLLQAKTNTAGGGASLLLVGDVDYGAPLRKIEVASTRAAPRTGLAG